MSVAAHVESTTHKAEVEALHRRCGIYTRPEIVRSILDGVGWRSKADLSQARLLEPSAGDGAFVVEAAVRLVESFQRCGHPLTIARLADRLLAFELHPREAEQARRKMTSALFSMSVHPRTAAACARVWIRTDDFLLADLSGQEFTHVVGNPPYVRWSKVPRALKAAYEAVLPGEMVGGDLFLPFLDRSLDRLRTDGTCGFLCSDRWQHMAFGEKFRNKWSPRLEIKRNATVQAGRAFQKDVDSYPTIFIAERAERRVPSASEPLSVALRTLEGAGYEVKVGPALGHTPAYVLEPDEDDVEEELLAPWIDASEIAEGRISWAGKRVISLHDSDGVLIDIKRFPRLRARLTRFRAQLRVRSIVVNGWPWYRTIDRVIINNWARPKLLVPELAKVPRLAIDRSGAIPSHGVYSIFAPDDNVEALYELLRDGKLAACLDGIAPRVRGGVVRCYKRFLNRIHLPVTVSPD